MSILVVTPTYNSERFLDDTIFSVVSQSGDFHLQYHIQDGGSADGTMAIVRRWERLLLSGDFPVLCAGIAFSYDSAPDSGMYQAINRGVTHARPGRPFVMGWINSDDRLAPGALAAVSGIYKQFADVNFTCARVSMIDQDGVIVGVNLPIAYDRQTLSEGLHDGRSHSFVMQEGSFWRSGLWDQVGGLDEKFRLAGDWDLWRRFARHAKLFTVDSVLGFHRRHDRQLSTDLQFYHAEVDAARQRSSSLEGLVPTDVAETLRFDLSSRQWRRQRNLGAPFVSPIVHRERHRPISTHRIELMRGARFPEGPYPEVNLPGGMQWIDDASAEAVVVVPYPGRWQMHFRIRNWRPDLHLTIRRGSTVCLDVMPSAGEDESDTLLLASMWLEGGRNDLRIDSEHRSQPTDGWVFIVLEWYVLALDPPGATLAAALDHHGHPGDYSAVLPSISVIMWSDDQVQNLDLRIATIIDQGYPNFDICVIDDNSSGVNSHILVEHSPLIDRLEIAAGESRHSAIGRAIDRSCSVLIAVLDDDATLAPGSLFALGNAFRPSDRFDIFTGITVDRDGSRPVMRRLLSLPNGKLPLNRVLSMVRQPRHATIFNQGALFFTRRIWPAIAGVSLEFFSGGDFDFWVRCAVAGASLRTLPVDLVHRSGDGTRRDASRRSEQSGVRDAADAGAQEASRTTAHGPVLTTRAALKIVIFDGGALDTRLSDGCRRLAATLTAANQRVVCIFSDENACTDDDGAAHGASILQAIAAERPELVVVFGDDSSEGQSVVRQLVANDTPTIFVSEGRSRLEESGTGDLLDERSAPRPSAAQREDRVLAKPYGAFVYGRGDDDQWTYPGGGNRHIVHSLDVGIDLTRYTPGRRVQARQILGLPADAFIMLALADHPTALSPRVAVILDAYDRLKCGNKHLIMMGYTGVLPRLNSPITRAGGGEPDDVRALYFAAADTVVSPFSENVELPLVQAAASGTPTIVAGRHDAKDGWESGPFGLRLSAWTGPLLTASLQRLLDNPPIRRDLSRSGRAYVVAKHSLIASAWSLMTMIGTMPGFRRLHLDPILQLKAEPPPFAIRALTTARKRPFLEPRWQIAGQSPTGCDVAVAGTVAVGLPGDKLIVYLRADHNGPQSLRILAASRSGNLHLAVVANGVDCGAVTLDAEDVRFESHLVRAPLMVGLNRIDLTLGSANVNSSRGLMLRSIDIATNIEADREGVPRPWEPIIGFAEAQPIDVEDSSSRWIDDSSATLRVWSNDAGSRQLQMALKNYTASRTVELTVDDTAVAIIDVPTTDFRNASRFCATVVVGKGWNYISLTCPGPSTNSEFGRDLLLIVDDVRLVPIYGPSFPDDLCTCNPYTAAAVVEH